MAAVRATRNVTQSKLLGKNVLCFLNYGDNATESNPVWALIGGQRSADYSSSADEIDLNDKNSDGYGESAAGIKSTELSLELLCKKADKAVAALWDAHKEDEQVDVLRWAKDGQSVRNWYTITEISESAAHDDAVTLSLTLKGCGAPVFTVDMADPRTGTQAE